MALAINLRFTDTDLQPGSKEARSRLLYARAKILGVVLNRVDMVKGEYAYYYGHYSSYYRRNSEELNIDQNDKLDQEKMSA